MTREDELRTTRRSAEDGIHRLIGHLGEDPNRDGLRKTPHRVVKAFEEMTVGYSVDIAQLFTMFENDGDYDQMVILHNIEFESMCEHHMLPFVGHATIGYLPGSKIVGISKLARLLEAYSKRLQVQERLTSEITNAINEHLKPSGAGCVIKAKHYCMCARGVRKQSSYMTTSSLTGSFRDDRSTRNEFLSLVNSNL